MAGPHQPFGCPTRPALTKSYVCMYVCMFVCITKCVYSYKDDLLKICTQPLPWIRNFHFRLQSFAWSTPLLKNIVSAAHGRSSCGKNHLLLWGQYCVIEITKIVLFQMFLKLPNFWSSKIKIKHLKKATHRLSIM